MNWKSQGRFHKRFCYYPTQCNACSRKRECYYPDHCGWQAKHISKYARIGYLLLTEKIYQLKNKKGKSNRHEI